jgi:hypothetical protein
LQFGIPDLSILKFSTISGKLLRGKRKSTDLSREKKEGLIAELNPRWNVLRVYPKFCKCPTRFLLNDM